jgi:hypothetical protein
MRTRHAILAGGAAVALLLTAAMLAAETRSEGRAAVAGERLVIKICHWDGVIPDGALDGYKLPAGKWAEFQKQGWKVEQYLVAPVKPQGAQGLYAVLRK